MRAAIGWVMVISAILLARYSIDIFLWKPGGRGFPWLILFEMLAMSLVCTGAALIYTAQNKHRPDSPRE